MLRVHCMQQGRRLSPDGERLLRISCTLTSLPSARGASMAYEHLHTMCAPLACQIMNSQHQTQPARKGDLTRELDLLVRPSTARETLMAGGGFSTLGFVYLIGWEVAAS